MIEPPLQIRPHLYGWLVSPAAPAVSFIGAAGVWAPEHVTVGATPSPAAPKKIRTVTKNRFLHSEIDYFF